MRLAFCFLSNKISAFKAMKNSFNYHIRDVGLPLTSFTKNVLFNPPVAPDWSIEGWNIQHKYYNHGPVIDMFAMRQDSIAMAGAAEFIFIGDDDLEFKAGATADIDDCIQYMIEHRDCGCIYLGGNFGGEGDLHQDEIYIANKGHVGTNRGIIVRNRSPFILEPKFHAAGANFDAIIAFTCLLQGYYVARKLHVPIEHHTSNVLKENHSNKFYDINFIREYGIMSKVNHLLGDWRDHGTWPENIFHYYNNSAIKKGFFPVYNVDGDII